MSHVYDGLFYDYIRDGALRSARKVLSVILTHLPVESVLDVGCGEGAWLSVWKESGVPTVAGIDGDYVSRSRLMIDAGEFQPYDLAMPFDLGRRFDLAQCLEVAEHLPEAAAAPLVRSLTRHSDLVLFSAAPPGQGGEDHISERPYDYWRALFADQGYVALDPVRPLIVDDSEVEAWYRFNTLLYVRAERLPLLPEPVRQSRLAEGQPVPDLSPAAYRLRKAVLRHLSPSWQTRLSRWRYLVRLWFLRRNAATTGRSRT